MKLDIIVASPAGNTTIFVITPVSRILYQNVAEKLLSLERYHGEQVAFIIPSPENKGSDGRIEMAGLEFCGNATRSFGLILAKQKLLRGKQEFSLEISGTKEPLDVSVDTYSGEASVSLPLPLSIETLSPDDFPLLRDSIMVKMDGITHIIVRDIAAEMETFDSIKEYVMKNEEIPALGVMFYDSSKDFMTPIVHVPGINMTYFENSCGSGTAAFACAAALADKKTTSYKKKVSQPGGDITVTVTKKENTIESVEISGPVRIGPVISLDIKV
jgi:diaminopimelate epimerase